MPTDNDTSTARIGSPWDVLVALYACEFPAGAEFRIGFESDWDNGVTVWVGAPPQIAKQTFGREDFGQVAEWMHREALRLCPEYAAAQRVHKPIR